MTQLLPLRLHFLIVTRVWIEPETVLLFYLYRNFGLLAQFKDILQIEDSKLATAQTENGLMAGWMDGAKSKTSSTAAL